MRILSLCSGTGAFEKPWVDAGHDVTAITLPDDIRILEYNPRGYDGIIAAPPCRCFTQTATSMPKSYTELIDALSVVDACMRAVALYHPRFWVLENPPGILKRFLGPATYTFQPWWFGGNRQKYTNLWGDFKIPVRTVFVRPGDVKSTGCIGRGGDYRRAVTPPEFAMAFFLANSDESSQSFQEHRCVLCSDHTLPSYDNDTARDDEGGLAAPFGVRSCGGVRNP